MGQQSFQATEALQMSIAPWWHVLVLHACDVKRGGASSVHQVSAATPDGNTTYTEAITMKPGHCMQRHGAYGARRTRFFLLGEKHVGLFCWARLAFHSHLFWPEWPHPQVQHFSWTTMPSQLEHSLHPAAQVVDAAPLEQP